MAALASATLILTMATENQGICDTADAGYEKNRALAAEPRQEAVKPGRRPVRRSDLMPFANRAWAN